jgi:hypothetical protein
MRNIALGQNPKPPGIQKDPTKPKSIVEVTNAEEYEKIVMGEADRVVVVRYYAPWCRVSVTYLMCFILLPEMRY